MNDHGLVRITVVSPKVSVGNPDENCKEIVACIEQTPGSQIYLFPELCITGYTCGDLFNQQQLLDRALQQLVWLKNECFQQTPALTSNPRSPLIVVGLPIKHEGSLYNCAAVLANKKIIGIVPKQHLPNYKEFYERRWFAPATGKEGKTIRICGYDVPFGIDLLFQDKHRPDLKVGVEVCEDVWTVIPPSSFQALAGATILLNLSASNETVGKSPYRRELVTNQSGRCIAAYAYASAGWTESTTDLVFGGHCMIAENGSMLKESKKFQRATSITADVCLEKITLERERTSSFADNKRYQAIQFRTVETGIDERGAGLERQVNAHPFVPSASRELEERCDEIFSIQAHGLAKRVESCNIRRLVIGVSGGLDSTLALLVAVRACDIVRAPRSMIRTVTMPGFGTSKRTKDNATKLMTLGVDPVIIDIRPLAMNAFHDIGHKPFGINMEGPFAYPGSAATTLEHEIAKLPPDKRTDVVFENVQARLRTFFLMSQGFVVGTGDMSELALGWCTYNGDHMSMYNPNCSIPKTLVKFLVRYVADKQFFSQSISGVLHDICDTVISPELLPLGTDGSIAQSTEQMVGPYELNDFFLFNMVRCGYGPKKILYLAENAKFHAKYSKEELQAWLKNFYKRFFANQFKRSCVPDGCKVGSVSLSPRGDWRMPSDADGAIWIEHEKN